MHIQLFQRVRVLAYFFIVVFFSLSLSLSASAQNTKKIKKIGDRYGVEITNSPSSSAQANNREPINFQSSIPFASIEVVGRIDGEPITVSTTTSSVEGAAITIK